MTTQINLCAGLEAEAPGLVGNTILFSHTDGVQDLIDESLKLNSVSQDETNDHADIHCCHLLGFGHMECRCSRERSGQRH
jgi:hypothetical protein